MKIYSKVEAGPMQHFQTVKDASQRPVTQTLGALHITANAVSVMSGTAAVLGLVLALATGSQRIFVAFILLHVVLDGLDGSLARATRKRGASARGLLFDLVADSVAMVSVGFYLLLFHIVSVPAAWVFLVAYTCVDVLSYQLAKRRKQYVFVVRPLMLIIGLIALDYFFALHTTPIAVLVSDTLLVFFAGLGFFKLANAK